ncbi:MAG: hypothetical protein ABFS46_18630, partial [Myxococcota bacterium]
PSPAHYIYFGLDRHRIADSLFLSTPAIAGAQLKYTWRELEPARGLSAIPSPRESPWSTTASRFVGCTTRRSIDTSSA